MYLCLSNLLSLFYFHFLSCNACRLATVCRSFFACAAVYWFFNFWCRSDCLLAFACFCDILLQLESEEFEKISSSQERQSFSEKLEEVWFFNITLCCFANLMAYYLCYSVAHISHLVHWNYFGLFLKVQEWLYTDGEDAKAAEFQERLDMLKAIGGPIFFRYVFRFFYQFCKYLLKPCLICSINCC